MSTIGKQASNRTWDLMLAETSHLLSTEFQCDHYSDESEAGKEKPESEIVRTLGNAHTLPEISEFSLKKNLNSGNFLKTFIAVIKIIYLVDMW